KRFELIAKPAQPGKPLFNIKETSRLHLLSSPINSGEMKSQRNPQTQRVFRTLHVVFYEENGIVKLRLFYMVF
ncbi:hypothetical protein AD929_00525, partial [Gluconobacter potus]